MYKKIARGVPPEKSQTTISLNPYVDELSGMDSLLRSELTCYSLIQ